MKKVLFIDGNKLVIKTVKNLLLDSAYQFISASNGIDGLCQLVEHDPDLIFIAANAAQLDGFHFCALIKSKAEFSHIPLIVVLEEDDYCERAKAEALGAETVLSKPFGKLELSAAIALLQHAAE